MHGKELTPSEDLTDQIEKAYSEWSQPLSRFALRLAANREDAEDIVVLVHLTRKQCLARRPNLNLAPLVSSSFTLPAFTHWQLFVAGFAFLGTARGAAAATAAAAATPALGPRIG